MSTEGVVGSSFKTLEVEVPEFEGAETVSIEEWADDIMSNVNGCTVNAAKQALVGAFREFCTWSGAWMRQLPPMDLEAGTFRYTIPAPPDAKILYIYTVGYSDAELNPATQGDRGWNSVLWPATSPLVLLSARGNSSGRPRSFTGSREVGGQMDLYPTPDMSIANALRPLVGLGPIKERAGVIPESVYRYHYETILNGTLARLTSQQEKPYSNMGKSTIYQREFRSGMSLARDMARRHYSSADSPIRFPPWE